LRSNFAGQQMELVSSSSVKIDCRVLL
jgi:hypothetical protein